MPSGSDRDVAAEIEAQIERFAPGFRDLVLARSVRTASDQERHDPNYVGGDINGGATSLRQIDLPPDGALEPLPDGYPWRLPLLVLDTSRRGSARHVRVLGRPDGAARPLRRAGAVRQAVAARPNLSVP